MLKEEVNKKEKANKKEKDVGYLHTIVSLTMILVSKLFDVSYFIETDTFFFFVNFRL